jgi:hypothetical protein
MALLIKVKRLFAHLSSSYPITLALRFYMQLAVGHICQNVFLLVLFFCQRLVIFFFHDDARTPLIQMMMIPRSLAVYLNDVFMMLCGMLFHRASYQTARRDALFALFDSLYFFLTRVLNALDLSLQHRMRLYRTRWAAEKFVMPRVSQDAL